MATKEEISEEINEILGTEIEWKGMKKEELELFYELIDNGALLEPQAKHIAKNQGKQKVDEKVDEWYPGKYAGRML